MGENSWNFMIDLKLERCLEQMVEGFLLKCDPSLPLSLVSKTTALGSRTTKRIFRCFEAHGS